MDKTIMTFSQFVSYMIGYDLLKLVAGFAFALLFAMIKTLFKE